MPKNISKKNETKLKIYLAKVKNDLKSGSIKAGKIGKQP